MFIKSLINFEKTVEYDLQVTGSEEVWVKIAPHCPVFRPVAQSFSASYIDTINTILRNAQKHLRKC